MKWFLGLISSAVCMQIAIFVQCGEIRKLKDGEKQLVWPP